MPMIETIRVDGARWLMCSRCGATHVSGVANSESGGVWITVDGCTCRRWFHRSCATEPARMTPLGLYASGPDWIASYKSGVKHQCCPEWINGSYVDFTRDDLGD